MLQHKRYIFTGQNGTGFVPVKTMIFWKISSAFSKQSSLKSLWSRVSESTSVKFIYRRNIRETLVSRILQIGLIDGGINIHLFLTKKVSCLKPVSFTLDLKGKVKNNLV